jgi:thiol-disulfide isomerase/thioredoxin
MSDPHPEDLLASLCTEDVVEVDPETDAVTVTESFAADREVYYDTYLSVSDENFHASVADVFDIGSAADAADRVAELDVTREEFATFLTLRSAVDGDYTHPELTRMARMVAELGPSTPVPSAVEHLDDDSYEAFVADEDRAVVTVWKLFCDPCEAMKEDLDAVLAALPADAPVGGVDGERCPAFCRDVGVDAAPAIVLFDDGDPVETITGRTDPEPLAERVAEVYGT